MVCSITRCPANPISALGSAMFISPSMAKLAVVPPVVGSVITEIKGIPACSSRATAWLVFINCIRDGRTLEAEEGEFGFRFNYTHKPTEQGGSVQETDYTFSPSLPGLHQGRNAATAIRAAEEISRQWKPLQKGKMVEGIETTSWPGRLELLYYDPLVALDGAHNPEGARALRQYAEAFLPKPITLLYAAMRDKDVGDIAGILFPAADRIILTSFPYFKALAPEEILALIPEDLRQRCSLEADFSSAIKKAAPSFYTKGEEVSRLIRRREGSSFSHGSVLIAGSLFLIGEAKKFFKEE